MNARIKQPEILPNPPSLMASLLAGFDAVATHVVLILFPAALDLFLWLGPHLKIQKLVASLVSVLVSSAQNTPDTAQALKSIQERGDFLAQHLNLFSSLRSFPVGIPSLMASRLPIQAPKGFLPITIDIGSPITSMGLLLSLSLLGLVLGALYFEAVANASVTQPKNWLGILKRWPRVSTQVLLLALVWVFLLFAVSIPAFIIISIFALISPLLAELGVLVFFAALIWLIFPLLMSPHGIFINQDNVIGSLKKSLRLTRMTLPTTGLLFLSIIILSQGLDVLWSTPPDNSWLALVGILGHSFVATSLLASTFVYYRNADQWIQAVIARWIQSPPAKLNV